MWAEDPREYIEQLFIMLSGVIVLSKRNQEFLFINPELRRVNEKIRRGTWIQEIRCQMCGLVMSGANVRSGRKWCSNRCKQRNKNGAK